MLTHLSVQNFTLVEQLDLDIDAGMTAITGETGAGKSILLDALGLTLGDRADGNRVRNGCPRLDVAASFDVSSISSAQKWLSAKDFATHEFTSQECKHGLDNQAECILRRVVTSEGRSRGYINGQPATLSQLRELGEMLIDIHSQHEHQSLLKKDTHRKLLDDFASLQPLAQTVKQQFRDWQACHNQYIELRDNFDDSNARYQLLSYQAQELNQLELQVNELEQLEQEQKQLANAESLLLSGQQVSAICSGDANNESYNSGGLIDGLNRALQLLRDLSDKSSALIEAEQLLSSAQIQVEEASSELDRHADSFQANPERLMEVEDRLSCIYNLARKHRINPENLSNFGQQLNQELEQLGGSDEQLEQLEQQAKALEQSFVSKAEKLKTKRHKAAKKLQGAVKKQLDILAMPHAQVHITFNDISAKPSQHGLEETEFLISTNPGQTPAPLHKVASGGELSRISLAIQVVTAQTSTTPTLVFDEVDVGIGGATADIVGQLLRQLGQSGGQVLCVTHLAQVASKGHNHLLVTKTSTNTKAESNLITLQNDEKVAEIARMLGGENITQQTLAHAREVLERAA